ncbi:geranylgeranyl reductase family protein [Cellulomonas fimi]|uniref:Geranylgeranyl reductase family protein n=1 Tax=Cellulomonas fimi TaxID=1708 RepID=A0A7Y0QGN8_CELFI|nr:geranylgeranyl reductase family protein [Cellulomonas fimi]NMR19079.1 geranylgeranyl reductase family protein [Cellulomonas fimi]
MTGRPGVGRNAREPGSAGDRTDGTGAQDAGSRAVAPASGPSVQAQAREADVIVVGAGPAGSSTALALAQAGLEVLLLEKDTFPREKVCGDGLTPRSVRALLAMGVDMDSGGGWTRTRGIRMISTGGRLELDWPDLVSFPSYGLVRSRASLDDALARRAVEAGAHLHQATSAVGLVRDDRSGRVIGVRTRHRGPGPAGEHGGDHGDDVELRAAVVVAADGVSSRVSLDAGLSRRMDRPLGVATRTYFTSPRHSDDYLETWLTLTDPAGRALPGYGWVFGMGDGTCNVGLGLLNAPGVNRHVDYRALLAGWLEPMPREWGFGEDTRTAPVTGAALPLAFNRTPHYVPGLMLVGDAGGMVNPYTGEGIAYALESGRIAADVLVQALGRKRASERERVLTSYPRALADAYGGYFALGRWFVKAMNHPSVMAAATQHGLSRPGLMRLAFALMGNLTDPRGDARDRILHALTRRPGS